MSGLGLSVSKMIELTEDIAPEQPTVRATCTRNERKSYYQCGPHWWKFHFQCRPNPVISAANINAAIRRILRAYNATKCDCGWGSTPDTVGGAYSIPPDSLTGFKGVTGGRRKGGEGKGREKKEKGRKGRGGKVDSDAQLEQSEQGCH